MRFLIGILVTIGLVILLIILLVSGGGNKSSVPNGGKRLSSYAATGAQAVMMVDGPVNAQQDHAQIRITVGKDQVTYEKLTGYDGSVTENHTFANSQAAYTSFLKSLSLAGFTKGDTTKSLQDERGFCPLGNRFIFELNQGGEQIERFWTTDCGGTHTYLGARGLTIQLFKNQVPGFSDLHTGLSL